MIRRIIKQLNRQADLVGKSDHALEKLSSYATAFRSIINFDLQQLSQLFFFESQSPPVSFQTIDNKITRFVGTAKE